MGSIPQAIKTIESRVGYELIKEIGKGSFATVYLAIRKGFGLDRYVAVKVIDMEKMDDRHRSVIKEEAKLLGRLSHPCIIHIYDAGLINEHLFYIVIELVNGFSLKDVIREHTRKVMDELKHRVTFPLSLMKHTAASILVNSALGLDYIHNARDLLTGEPLHIIHNDLKPGNILIGLNGTLKVSDFGISYSPMRSVRLRGGSPAYMAPEWIRSMLSEEKSIEPKVTFDIYSLGICLHETLTDRRLFKAPRPNMERTEMLQSIYRQMERFKPGMTVKVNPAADRKLCQVVDRCLEFEPGNRYASVQEIIHEVDQWISEGHFHPEILDRRFLAEYMSSLYPGDEISRFQESLKEDG